ncbi:MAG: hypothetical protein JW751_24150 [Polyangiaceae bacterium]|nr:hypothetical protein [Polyangiaceae bacterium]
MVSREVLRGLLRLAQILGIEVRTEPFERRAIAGGGLCSLRGRRVILLDGKAPAVDRAAALADALSRIDLSGANLDPKVTLAIAAARARRRWEEQRCTRARPRRIAPAVYSLPRPKPGVRSTRPRKDG